MIFKASVLVPASSRQATTNEAKRSRDNILTADLIIEK
jgi:hypothetical protein